MRKNTFISAALIALVGMGLVGCSDNPDRITNVNEIVKEQVDLGGYVYSDNNGNGSVDSGEGLAGVIVQVHDSVQDKTVTATTDTNGRYDFTTTFTEGAYNITLTDSSSTPNGAIVNSVEYYMPELQIDLTQPGDGADGTPEQGAIAIDFPMVSNPVLLSTNLGNISQAGHAVDLTKLTEITFTFNKPVTVINDPALVDLTAVPNKVMTLTAGTSASIKAATVQTSTYTTVAYKLPTLDANHQFSLTWAQTDVMASDNNQTIYNNVEAGEVALDPNTAGYAGVVGAALAGLDNLTDTLAGTYGTTANNSLNTGSVQDIVTTTNVPVIKSVTVASNIGTGANTVYSPIGGKFAIFAPAADVSAAQRNSVVAGSAGFNLGMITKTFAIQISNVKSDLDYTPVVSYDGGTTWYFAGTGANSWIKGSTANNGSLTLTTAALDNLSGVAGELPRPYFLVKGFYNTSTTEGENYTRLKVAVRRANADVTMTAGLQVGATGDTDDAVAGYSANGIDKNSERSSDTWVNIFDGDLTDYKNRGFNRMQTTATALLVNVVNGLPHPTDNEYQGSSHPYPLFGTSATTLGRANWFGNGSTTGYVQDHEILTDLVEPDGDMRNTAVLTVCPSAWGLDTATDMVISGMEEAASATINVNDVPNPSLGTSRSSVIYVYFNEPMDSTTITTSTNWRMVQNTGASVPTISKVEYSEQVNTANGLECFRAKVTLSATPVTGNSLQIAMGALVDKNGNYAVITDNTKPTSYVEVFRN